MSESSNADLFIENIRQVLIQVWDPKGVAKKPAFHDEYDEYLDLILDSFEEENASPAQLTEMLLALQQEDYKKQRGATAAIKAAEQIWQHLDDFLSES